MPNGDAEPRKDIAHQAVGSAVRPGRGNQLISITQKSQEGAGKRCHAGGGNDRIFGAFECGNFFLSHRERGIAVAGIHEGFAFSFGPMLQFFRGSKGERGGANDGGSYRRTDSVAGRLAGVNGTSLGPVLVGGFFHGEIIGFAQLGDNLQIGAEESALYLASESYGYLGT